MSSEELRKYLDLLESEDPLETAIDLWTEWGGGNWNDADKDAAVKTLLSFNELRKYNQPTSQTLYRGWALPTDLFYKLLKNKVLQFTPREYISMSWTKNGALSVLDGIHDYNWDDAYEFVVQKSLEPNSIAINLYEYFKANGGTLGVTAEAECILKGSSYYFGIHVDEIIDFEIYKQDFIEKNYDNDGIDWKAIGVDDSEL